MNNCPFCALTDRIAKENDTAQVILSNPRKVPGHSLVIPKRHVEKPWDLTTDELRDIFELIFFIEQRYLGKLGDGVDIRQNYRPYLKQNNLKIDHVHFHVIPRSNQDYLYTVAQQFEDGLFAALDDTEQEAVISLLQTD